MTTTIDRSMDQSSPGRRSTALWSILTVQLMLQMDFLIVLVALPKIQAEFGFSNAGLSWVPNAFALAFGGLLLLGGRLGDMFGQVRTFKIGLAIFVLASLIGSFAGSQSILIIARVLQGIGAAVAGPSVLALIAGLARNEAERNRGLSLFIAISSIGGSMGLILGGVFTELISWRLALLINVPIGAFIFLIIGRLVSETTPKPSKLDLGGAVSGTLGSIALVCGFISAAEIGWTNGATFLSFIVAAFLLLSFFVIESKHRVPLLDLDLLRRKARLGGLIVMALIVGMHFSLLYILVQYLQQVLGLGALESGFAYLPLTATVFTITHFIPRLIQRYEVRALLVTGCILVAVSFFGFASLDASSSYFPAVLIPLLIHASGIALVFAPATVIIMADVPGKQAGTASGLLQMNQQIGGALGIAIILTVYAAFAIEGQYVPGLSYAFVTAALISIFSALLVWRFISKKHV